MTAHTGFQPHWASPPGDTIADILRERGMSRQTFAKLIDHSIEDVDSLLAGRREITHDLAERLHVALGASANFWMRRQTQYVADRSRILQQPHLDTRDWLKALPLADMIRFGWIAHCSDFASQAEECLRFFACEDVLAWRSAYSGVLDAAVFRTSPSFDSSPAAVAAWMRQGELKARAITCAPWDKGAFIRALRTIRALSRQRAPEVFIPRLQEDCAGAGVAVVVLRAPRGCRASGVARFLSPSKAILQLSARHLTDDQFWFSFFHEAAHLVIHGATHTFLEGLRPALDPREDEANAMAADMLIPADYLQEMLSLPREALPIIRFAKSIGVSPGIVVGQLQHRGRIGFGNMNRLKRRYDWSP